ncbi:MAG: hypothetical protein WEB00_14550 [Dehalococcoidia bacterium]
MEIAKATRDRRGFLAAAVGGVMGLLAGRVAHPQAARALDGQAVLMGADNLSQTPTIVRRDNLAWESRADFGSNGMAVYGYNNATVEQGETAQGGGLGVYGFGNVGMRAEGRLIGVEASAESGGVALDADVGLGIGVRTKADLAGGSALVVDGVSLFLKRSGRAVINAGANSKTVNAAPIYTQSLVLATIQGDVPGLFVRGVKLSPGAGTFTIHLNKAATQTVKVGWFIVN